VASEIYGLISMEHYWNDTEGKTRSIRRIMPRGTFSTFICTVLGLNASLSGERPTTNRQTRGIGRCGCNMKSEQL
jgi:hypothetical protein